MDRWLAIACFTDAEWRALAEAAGHPEWPRDARFTDLAARLKNQDALDALVAGWTRSQDAYQAMLALQRAGVPAGVCQTAEDRCDHDPQLAALKWLTEAGNDLKAILDALTEDRGNVQQQHGAE